MSIADIKRQAVYGGEVVRALEKWRLKEEREHGRKADTWWHPSAICGCPTAAVYAFLEFPMASPPHDAQLLRIFDLGHWVHDGLSQQFVQAGIVPKIPWAMDVYAKSGARVRAKGTEYYGVEVPLQDEKYRLLGELDIIFEVGSRKFVGELKTKNSNAFAKMQAAEPKHIVQVTQYHWKAADYGWVNSDRANIIYYSKDDSKMREFPVEVTGKMITDVQTKIDLMNGMVLDFRENLKVPEPFYSESHKPPCRFCSWAPVCHASMTREAWVDQIKARQGLPPAPPKIRRPPVRVT